MPIVHPSSYEPTTSLLYRYTESISSSVFGQVKGVKYERERLELDDGDFLDLDWLRSGNHRLVILSSGMEGSSDRHYMKRTSKYFHERNWDVLAWNYRGCGGELNRLPILYSYAETGDFQKVIEYCLSQDKYSAVALIGFSMGGCLVTKYLGQNPDPRIVASVTFSVSTDLENSMEEVERPRHYIYNKYFISRLKRKLEMKAQVCEEMRGIAIERMNSFNDYVRLYNMPFHGFKDLKDFYEKSSCAQFISTIKIPSLMVNALNDPVLGKRCYPYDLARDHPWFYLETPAVGGHLSFPKKGPDKSWMPQRAFEFITSYAPSR